MNMIHHPNMETSKTNQVNVKPHSEGQGMSDSTL